MKKTILAVAIAAVFAPALAMAEAGDIVVRLRATNINPDESSELGKKTNETYNGGAPGLSKLLYGSDNANLKVEDNTIPEIDISYYITKNIAVELIAALGSKHNVYVSPGNGLVQKQLGTVNILPPTLTAQWHFLPDQTFDPYAGAGITYVRAMDDGLTAYTPIGNYPIRIDKNMWGPAIQAGFDVNLKDRWLVNFDVKKIWVSTDVKLNLSGNPVGLPGGYQKIDNLDLNPWVISVGFGKKF